MRHVWSNSCRALMMNVPVHSRTHDSYSEDDENLVLVLGAFRTVSLAWPGTVPVSPKLDSEGLKLQARQNTSNTHWQFQVQVAASVCHCVGPDAVRDVLHLRHCTNVDNNVMSSVRKCYYSLTIQSPLPGFPSPSLSGPWFVFDPPSTYLNCE